MVFTHDPFKNPHVLRIADLLDKVAAAALHIPGQDVVAVFRYPYHMRRQPRNGMPTPALLMAHAAKLQQWVATESLALKAHILTSGCDQ